jgi:hypothetical protein
MTGENNAFTAPQRCAGDDGIAVAHQAKARELPEGNLHRVGKVRFVARDAVDVNQRCGQQRYVLAEIEGYRGGFGNHPPTLSLTPMPSGSQSAPFPALGRASNATELGGARFRCLQVVSIDWAHD